MENLAQGNNVRSAGCQKYHRDFNLNRLILFLSTRPTPATPKKIRTKSVAGMPEWMGIWQTGSRVFGEKSLLTNVNNPQAAPLRGIVGKAFAQAGPFFS
ncbi:MAG TPA: hypothetical protein VIU93_09770 [Gallionellaceae bacterium]